MESKPNPATPSLAHQRQAPAVKVMRDVMAGTLHLRQQGETYLPKFPLESRDGYRDRLATAVLYNATARTVRGLVGMVFRRDPVLGDDVPQSIRDHAENIDLAGRALPVFARDLLTEAMTDGHAGIFIDWQVVEPGQIPTLADERAVAARPYWILLRKQDILRARATSQGGHPVLSELAFRETAVEPVDEYAERAVERVRIYRRRRTPQGWRVWWETWRKAEKSTRGDEWTMERSGWMTLDRIPFVPVYVNRAGLFESEPPLLDLALENLKHYQLTSDHDSALHIAGTPIPVFIGLREDAMVGVGADIGIKLPMGGDAKYLEAQGNSLAAGRQRLLDSERRMAVLGLSMLMSETRSAETATSKEIDKAESDSQLATAARGLEDAIEEALSLHALWLGLGEDAGGSLSVNRDFRALQLSPQMVQALDAMVAAGRISLDTLWQMLVRGEVLPDTFDAEAERTRLDEGDMERLPAADPKARAPLAAA